MARQRNYSYHSYDETEDISIHGNYIWDSNTLAWIKQTAAASGGGGPVSIADGADVTQGAVADAAWVSGNGTVISLLKKIASSGASAGLTDTQLRATPVPVSGPLTDTQLRAVAVPVSGTFFQGTQPVSGPLTDTQLRLTPVPVSGTVSVGTVPVTGPLTDTQLRATAVTVSGTFFQGTQPVSAVSLPLPAGASTETTLATRLSESDFDIKTGSLTEVAPASDTASSGLSGRLQRVAQRLTSLIALLPAALVGGRLDTNNGAWLGSTAPTVGQKTMVNSLPVVIASDQPVLASTLHVTATSLVNVGSTCTLPAAGVGLFHYITYIELKKYYALVGVSSGTPLISTSTNLPGSPAWTIEQSGSGIGSCYTVVLYSPTGPLKSSVANTATTFVAPAQLQTIWRWNVSYFTSV